MNTTTGGNSPVMLLNRSCRDIQNGDQDVILMTGCEAMYSRLLARRAGGRIEWPQQSADVAECAVIGDATPPTNNAEMAIGLILPVQIYPMLENALRHRLGRTVEEQSAVIGDLWSRFSEVAAGNQYAWSPQARSAEDLVTASPDNRMVAFPYTKLLTANLQVDQAAGAIVCSVEAAQRLGIPEDRWVFPFAGAEGKDHNFLSERDDLSRSPCIAACGRALEALSGVAPADASHVDLYSCFPIAVEIAAAELGLPLERQLTLTGGLTFGGGPGNAYAFHGLAEAVAACRREPGSVALTTALGWYVTKHTLSMLSTTPNPEGFGWRSVQDEVATLPKRAVAEGYEGPVTVEAATVAYDRDGEPEKVLAAVLTPDGARGWASSADRVLADEFIAGGVIRRAGESQRHRPGVNRTDRKKGSRSEPFSCQFTRRAMRVRSRPVRSGRTSASSKPASSANVFTASAWWGAISMTATPGRRNHMGAPLRMVSIASVPSGSGEQGVTRFPVDNFLRQILIVGDVGRVRQDQVDVALEVVGQRFVPVTF